MSAYVDSLDAVAQDRYFRKCALLGVDKCPYSIQEDAWVDDATVWPPVIWPEVHEYLINSVGQFTNSAMKAFTSLDAYRYYHDGWVQAVYVLRSTASGAIVVLKANVMPSQRTTERCHKVWLGVRSNGSVAAAHCTCMAG
jgi:hypothetical protein